MYKRQDIGNGKKPKFIENLPIDELALIKYEDGTETAIFSLKEYDERHWGYQTADKRGINYARNFGTALRELLNIRLTDMERNKWRNKDVRNKILREHFDPRLNECLKLFFRDVGVIAKTNNYKLDTFRGYSLLFMEIDTEHKGRQTIVAGHPDTFLTQDTSMFIAAPGQIRPDIVAAVNALSVEYYEKTRWYYYGQAKANKWSLNRRVALITELVLIDALKMAILLEQDPRDIYYEIDGRRVSLHEIYKITSELDEFAEESSNYSSLNDRKVNLAGKQVPLSIVIQSLTGIPIDKDGNVELRALLDESEKPIPTDSITEEHYAKVLEEVRGVYGPIDKIIHRALNDLIAEIHEVEKKGGSSYVHKERTLRHARSLAKLIGKLRHHNLLVLAVKLYPQLRDAGDLNTFEIGGMLSQMVTDDVYYSVIERLEKIKNGKNDAYIDEIIDVIKGELLPNYAEQIAHERGKNLGATKHRFSIYSLYLSLKMRGSAFIKEVSGGVWQNYAAAIVAPIVFTATIDFIMTLIERNPKGFSEALTDRNTLLVIGVGLSTVILLLFNGIDNRFNFGDGSNAETQGLSAFRMFFDPIMLTGTMLSAVGMFFRMFGAPFYQGKELVLEIGKLIGEHIDKTAEDVWDMVAGYEIPLVDQTVFETVVNLVVGGWKDAVMGLVIGLITSVINNLLSSFVKPLVGAFTYDLLMSTTYF